MPDLIDFATEQYEARREEAVAEFIRQRRFEAVRGLPHCFECAEPITDARRLAGARRCVECQRDHETRERVLRGIP